MVFNEKATSTLTIAGVTYNSAGLGLSLVTGNAFQSNANIDASTATLDAALTTLRNQASKFGSNLTTVQTRQDFTKNLINTLQTGADSLVLADSNEEGANMLALQTRQQPVHDRAVARHPGQPGGAAAVRVRSERIASSAGQSRALATSPIRYSPPR